ncbi:calcineurin-binding protein cabin-1-like isoform X2 [Rhodnius prolixus]|uniref:calcineurin-binding protein cabin-1-like isoform X2 n=1 Tax=Rhodnius prolixus TaxID=13249 RepID=UPI003D18957E
MLLEILCLVYTIFIKDYKWIKLASTPPEVNIDCDKVKEMYKSADNLKERARIKAREKFYKKLKEEEPLMPELPVILDTWIDVYKCLLYLYDKAEREVREKNMFRPLRLRIENSEESPVHIQVEESDSEVEDSDNNNKGVDDAEEEDNGKGRNGNLMEKLLSSQNQKRRSARVRSTIRREEPCIANTFARLIPLSLLPKDYKKESEAWSEDSMHTMDLYRLYKEEEDAKISKSAISREQRDQFIEEEDYFNTKNEINDINTFIDFIEINSVNIIDVLKYANLKLAEKWKFHWPEELCKYYTRVFLIYLKYNPIAMKSDMEPNTLVEDLSILTFGELLLHEWLTKGKQQGMPTPLGNTLLGGDFSSLFLGCLNNRAYDTGDVEFIIRAYWLEALLLFYSGDVEGAARALQQVIYDERCDKVQVQIPNITKHTTVNKGITVNLLKSFKRNKRLEQVMDLYNTGYYEEVTDTLADSLNAEEENETGDTILSRPMQYSLILDSYWKLANHKECVCWSESCLYETLSMYRNCSDEERSTVASIIVSVLQGIVSCVDIVGCSVFQTMPTEKLTRLIQTLRDIINQQMEAADNSTEMPIESVAPWIILYYIIKSEEELKERSLLKKSDGEEEEELPASLQMLFMGHEYLGRRAWCCFDEGSLLFQTLKVLYPFVQTLPLESSHYIKIIQQVDQIFYCLYGQQKKNKARHIVDHNVLGLAMTWNRAQQVFVFARPRELPSYDSTGRCCVTGDMENLYLKLLEMVPNELNPERLLSEMTKYIEGQLITVPRNDKPLPEDITDIYYLLAHFYFKSKSWNKAIKFFLLDICANPTRVDSWACLALARGSLIDSKLNSCETIKNELEFLSTSSMVCKSYERALELDPGQCTLWIERGTFSYTIHSFCSNVLKKEQNLSIEMYSILEKQKDSMLNAAKFCFSSANKLWYSVGGRDLQDERWLHHYMLGKIAKKQDADPDVIIGHYVKSAELLHEIGATYPSQINYSSPQFLSVEALELYYRVHASILKCLEESEDRPLPESTIRVFKNAINTLSQCPFVLQVKTFPRIEKLSKPRKTYTSSEDEELTISKDVQDMLQDLIVKVDTSDQGSNSLKRRHSSSTSDDDEPPSKLGAGEDASSDDKATYPVARRSTITSESSDPCKTENADVTSDKASTTSSSDSNKSSNSSSSDSSSDSDSTSSSSSSSSSDSDSSSSESDNDSNDEEASQSKKLKRDDVEPSEWRKDHDWLTKKCITALELCTKRFSQHYKTLYHLAHFFFKSKLHKNNERVQEILLGQNGLFYDRKPSNFFNGLWRIPSHEIDRAGSFAAHMGRCVLLLIDFLRETKDYKMLIDLSLQLKLIPEADKKYLRDNERDELCKEAAVLCAQCLRRKVQELSGDKLKEFLIDVYYIHKRVARNNLRESTFACILADIYVKYTKKTENGSVLDAAIRYCQQEIALQKQQQQLQQQQLVTVSSSSSTSINFSSVITTTSSTKTINLTENHSPVVSVAEVNTVVRQRGNRGATTGRKPRGRPPNSSVGPRMPTPRQADISQLLSMPQFSALMYQNELVRQLTLQNAELNRQLAMSSPANPLAPPNKFSSVYSVSSPSTTVTTTAASQPSTKTPEISQVSPPILKDRPSLSITPIKPNSPSTSNITPKSNMNPISVSVTKFTSKSLTKLSNNSTSTSQKSGTQRKSAPLLNLPPHPLNNQTSISRSSNQLFSPLLQTTTPQSTNQSLKSSILSTKSLSVTQIPVSTNSTSQAVKKTLPISVSVINPSLSITSKSLLAGSSSFDKSLPVSVTTSAIVTSPKSQEPSLQHKILSAKKISTQNYTKKTSLNENCSEKTSSKSVLHNNDVNIPGGLTINRSPTKQASYSQVNPPPRNQPPKTLLESLTITPSTTKMEPYSKNPTISSSKPVKLDDKLKLFSKVTNLDSSVADAIRNFGSSITITTSNPKNKSESSSSSTLQTTLKSKEKSTEKAGSDPFEVIVLDD